MGVSGGETGVEPWDSVEGQRFRRPFSVERCFVRALFRGLRDACTRDFGGSVGAGGIADVIPILLRDSC